MLANASDCLDLGGNSNSIVFLARCFHSQLCQPYRVPRLQDAMRAAQKESSEDCEVKMKLVAPPLYVLTTYTLDKAKVPPSADSNLAQDQDTLSNSITAAASALCNVRLIVGPKEQCYVEDVAGGVARSDEPHVLCSQRRICNGLPDCKLGAESEHAHLR